MSNFKVDSEAQKVNGYWVYPYRVRQNGKPKKLWCLANPNHNYPYECYGNTVFGSIKTKEEAISLANDQKEAA